MKNCWYIGDIHGEIGLLDKLLEAIRKYKPYQIVFVGDYIDRGPHTREVIDRIMELELPVACLMGNHEQMMLKIQRLGSIPWSYGTGMEGRPRFSPVGLPDFSVSSLRWRSAT